MEKTRNELLGLVSGLVKNGVSIDELYNYIKDKFEVETDKTINDFSSIIEKYKGQYVIIDEIKDDLSSLMLVNDVEFSGGRTREYAFHGPIINFMRGTTEDEDLIIGNCYLSYDSSDYNYFSKKELEDDVRIITREEAENIIKSWSDSNSEAIIKLFLS